MPVLLRIQWDKNENLEKIRQDDLAEDEYLIKNVLTLNTDMTESFISLKKQNKQENLMYGWTASG